MWCDIRTDAVFIPHWTLESHAIWRLVEYVVSQQFSHSRMVHQLSLNDAFLRIDAAETMIIVMHSTLCPWSRQCLAKFEEAAQLMFPVYSINAHECSKCVDVNQLGVTDVEVLPTILIHHAGKLVKCVEGYFHDIVWIAENAIQCAADAEVLTKPAGRTDASL